MTDRLAAKLEYLKHHAASNKNGDKCICRDC